MRKALPFKTKQASRRLLWLALFSCQVHRIIKQPKLDVYLKKAVLFSFNSIYWGLGLPWWLRWKSVSTMREAWVQSLGQEDSLEKEMATHSSTLIWKIPWTEEPGAGYCAWGRRVRHDWSTSLSLWLDFIVCIIKVFFFFFSPLMALQRV